MERTLTGKIRRAASEFGDFTVNDLATSLNMRSEKEMRRIRTAIKDLKSNKEIIALRRGLYRYTEKEKPLNKITKMWRAMRIKEYFTRRDIKLLSGASEAFVIKYFKYLVNKGFISHVSGFGFKDRLYCLNNPDKAPLNHPVYRTRGDD